MRSRTRRALLAALPGLSLAWLARAAPATSATESAPGRLEIHENFPSRHVAPRSVRVWLPPDHDRGEACDVLYMQDGQNLFAPANPWGHGPWDVDRHLLALRAQGGIRKTMVVGIDSAGVDRSREYAPQAALERLPAQARRHGLGAEGAPLLGEAYLRFLVGELKPFIDGRYRTRAGRAHTHAVGSSLGGVVSLYALARYSKVFGAAACLSTHWPIALGPGMLEPEPSAETLGMADAFLGWLADSLPRAGRHRLYFDHGDQTLDALYGPFQARMNEIAARKGYRAARDYRSEAFPGSPHDESAWRARLAIPLSFLLAKGRS
jgi:enterochelin esterase-like enzyme